jgi:hypothetical protein
LLALVIPAISFSQTQKLPKAATGKPFVLGLIDELPSVELAEKRILNIYLPEGYQPKDTSRYPVVYLLDGSANEDFIHVVGLYQFNNFSWISRVPKSIIVGIANVDRKQDFTYPTTLAEDKRRYPTSGQSGNLLPSLKKNYIPMLKRNIKSLHPKQLLDNRWPDFSPRRSW